MLGFTYIGTWKQSNHNLIEIFYVKAQDEFIWQLRIAAHLQTVLNICNSRINFRIIKQFIKQNSSIKLHWHRRNHITIPLPVK